MEKGARRGQSLTEWWAKYLESQGDLEKALQVYEQTNNVLGQVSTQLLGANSVNNKVRPG